jgi:hypothetical protein
MFCKEYQRRPEAQDPATHAELLIEYRRDKAPGAGKLLFIDHDTESCDKRSIVLEDSEDGRWDADAFTRITW